MFSGSFFLILTKLLYFSDHFVCKGTLSSQNDIQNVYSKIIKHLPKTSIRNLKFKSIQNKSNRTCLIWSLIGTGIGALTL